MTNYKFSDSNQLEEIRRMTGVCPQHDVLFDQLTPREHLAFYAKIRVRLQTALWFILFWNLIIFYKQGVDANLISNEVEKTLKDIDLGPKGNTLAGKLSGGQKRKLSIGIALIGDPKVRLERLMSTILYKFIFLLCRLCF